MLPSLLLALLVPTVIRSADAYHSWPMIVAGADRLVCCYSSGIGHEVVEGERGVYSRVSLDGGRTWQPEHCVVNDPTVGEAVCGRGVLADGTMLFWVRSWWKPDQRRHELYRTRDGIRFERQLTLSLDPNPIQVTDIFEVEGVGLMSLWFAGDYRDGTNHSWGTLVSADGGRSWQSQVVERNLAKSEWPTEPSAVALGDGRILAIARRDTKGPQWQLTSTDGGKTWTRQETNIADTRISTPSLILDRSSGKVFNYYYERGRKLLKRRVATLSEVWADARAWPAAEVLARGNEERHYDAGNVNAVAAGGRHHLAYYSGSSTNTAVLVVTADLPSAVDLIDPRVGTVTDSENSEHGGHGLGKTFPGATTPFGMVQLSPDTITGGDNGPGYSATHKTIEGFSFTHMSGIGWYGDLGNFQVMPTTGPRQLDRERSASSYSHDHEAVAAGYYAVELERYQIWAEMSASEHAGILRFHYPEREMRRVEVDLGRRVGQRQRHLAFSRQTAVRVGPSAFEGEIVCDCRDGGWGRGDGKVNYTVYYRAEFSEPMAAFALAEKGALVSTGAGSNLVAVAEFPASERPLLLKVGISFSSLAEARGHLTAEIPAFDFEAVHAAARQSWTDALRLIDVKGGSEKARRIFATALYHAFIDPRAIGRGRDFTRRTVFSGWDVFRSEMPLLTLVRPDIVRDTILSMSEIVTSGRRDTLPVWDLFGCQSECMLGNPLIPVIATAVEAGVTDFDTALVYRQAQDTSAKRGNTAAYQCCREWRSLSKTLEYCYDDWCMARLAERFGTPEEVRYYEDRAKWYTNCWDATVGWMRGWDENGERIKWEGREVYGQGCAESNPHQQAWFVPHDPEGLAALMGGKAKFTRELDDFFAATPKHFGWNSAYNHPNEPCHTIPFLYAYSEKPYLVGYWTRRICERAYGTGVKGLCGNDDVGQMSAWYLLSSIGLHPLCPGSGKWIVTAPCFAETALNFNHRYAKAKRFVIRALGVEDPENVYVHEVRLNGRRLTRAWVTTAEIFAGGELEIDLRPRPRPATVSRAEPLHARRLRRHSGIPSVAVSPVNGRLWATWYAGPLPAEDENNYVVLATRAADETEWKEVLVADPDGIGGRRAFDPELAVIGGKLHWTWTERKGTVESDPKQDRLMRLELDAENEPTGPLPPPSRLGTGVMMCKPTQLASGEWLFPISEWGAATSAVFYASADGRALTRRGGVSLPAKWREFDEHQLVELANGDLLATIRTRHLTKVARSADRGCTWSAPAAPRSFGQLVARMLLRRLKSGNLLMVKNGNRPLRVPAGGKRIELTAFLSRDDGQTWEGGLTLDARECSYPDGDQAADGTIHVIYDHDRRRTQQILLASFTEADVLAGKLVSPGSRLGEIVSKSETIF